MPTMWLVMYCNKFTVCKIQQGQAVLAGRRRQRALLLCVQSVVRHFVPRRCRRTLRQPLNVGIACRPLIYFMIPKISDTRRRQSHTVVDYRPLSKYGHRPSSKRVSLNSFLPIRGELQLALLLDCGAAAFASPYPSPP
jgi:hypothetical protein